MKRWQLLPCAKEVHFHRLLSKMRICEISSDGRNAALFYFFEPPQNNFFRFDTIFIPLKLWFHETIHNNCACIYDMIMVIGRPGFFSLSCLSWLILSREKRWLQGLLERGENKASSSSFSFFWMYYGFSMFFSSPLGLSVVCGETRDPISGLFWVRVIRNPQKWLAAASAAVLLDAFQGFIGRRSPEASGRV